MSFGWHCIRYARPLVTGVERRVQKKKDLTDSSGEAVPMEVEQRLLALERDKGKGKGKKDKGEGKAVSSR